MRLLIVKSDSSLYKLNATLDEDLTMILKVNSILDELYFILDDFYQLISRLEIMIANINCHLSRKIIVFEDLVACIREINFMPSPNGPA